ncbi:MAG: efflux RND transporter periplasmic adaptor subunit [Spirochaetaceae bacterium]|jgi:multidrug efflux pump subunit AcrA (membrane-fusion protein)|nr:efflux RND transporter periplasmic adaptor subunit [Spirochaetaceae bacterium]
MAKKIGMKSIALFVGTALAASGLLFVPSMLAGNTAGSVAAAETPVFAVKTAPVQVKTLRVFLQVNGDIVSAQQAEVFPDTSGKLVSVRVTLGSRVRKGDLIAEIDPSRAGSAYMSSPVYAPISGIVILTPLVVGMTVSPGTGITTISVDDQLEISARIPEREISGLVPGLKAEVSLQAYRGEMFAATVTRVSPVLDAISRTKLITLTFDKNDSRINAGMFARLRINTRNYTDVLTVPAEAVLQKNNVSAVYVSRAGGMEKGLAESRSAELRSVTTGVTIDGWTEIAAGLLDGEAVVIQGQQLLSDGAALWIIAHEAVLIEE